MAAFVLAEIDHDPYVQNRRTSCGVIAALFFIELSMAYDSDKAPTGTDTEESVDRLEGAEFRSERRRLLITGLAAAPFLLTLAARPARASHPMGSVGCYDYGGGGDDEWGDDESSDDLGWGHHSPNRRRIWHD